MLLINISIIAINSIISFLGGWYLGDIQIQRQLELDNLPIATLYLESN